MRTFLEDNKFLFLVLDKILKLTIALHTKHDVNTVYKMIYKK